MSMGRRRKIRHDLPARMYFKHSAYYFVDKTSVWHPLGKDYQVALIKYADLNTRPFPLTTMGQIMDRYLTDIIPTKAPRTQLDNLIEIGLLKSVFGHMPPDDIEPQDIYAYMDTRPPVRANREKSLLSHVFTKAIRWGATTTNPCRLVQANPEKPRDRYVTDEEFMIVYNLASPFMKIAMGLALVTGLRQRDILDLRRQDCTDEGLMVKSQKTGKVLLFEWTPLLEKFVQEAKSLRGDISGIHLICTRQGQKYSSSGFQSIWRRLIDKAVKDKGIESYQWRDIRGKTGSDHVTGEILGHQDTRVRERHYRRKPTQVTPISPKILDNP